MRYDDNERKSSGFYSFGIKWLWGIFQEQILLTLYIYCCFFYMMSQFLFLKPVFFIPNDLPLSFIPKKRSV